MHESQRYRYKAAECLRTAQEARDHFHRKVHLSMAMSWLSLAREGEAAAVRFSKASSTPTISPIFHSRSVTPAIMAGVT